MWRALGSAPPQPHHPTPPSGLVFARLIAAFISTSQARGVKQGSVCPRTLSSGALSSSLPLPLVPASLPTCLPACLATLCVDAGCFAASGQAVNPDLLKAEVQSCCGPGQEPLWLLARSTTIPHDSSDWPLCLPQSVPRPLSVFNVDQQRAHLGYCA